MSKLFSFHSDQAAGDSRETQPNAKGAHNKSKCI